jgi:hypothetical protein
MPRSPERAHPKRSGGHKWVSRGRRLQGLLLEAVIEDAVGLGVHPDLAVANLHRARK